MFTKIKTAFPSILKTVGIVLFCAVFIGGCCGACWWVLGGGSEDVLCENVDEQAQAVLEKLIEWEFPEDMTIDRCTETVLLQGYTFEIYANYSHEAMQTYLEQHPLSECTVSYRKRFGTEYVVIVAGESVLDKEEYALFLQQIDAA